MLTPMLMLFRFHVDRLHFAASKSKVTYTADAMLLRQKACPPRAMHCDDRGSERYRAQIETRDGIIIDRRDIVDHRADWREAFPGRQRRFTRGPAGFLTAVGAQ